MPQQRSDYQTEVLRMLIPSTQPRFDLSDQATVRCRLLHYIPDLTGAGFTPNPAILAVFDRLREAVTPAAGFRPHRTIYVSRADSHQRRLLNETEVIDALSQHGFETVMLAGKSVREQIELFAEASHIVAPHGAGLTNIVFCQPGARLLELHMDGYIHSAFRSFAGIRGLQYGCLVGARTEPAQDWIHHNTWTVDIPTLLDTLANPMFRTWS